MEATKFKYCPVCECGFFCKRNSAKFCSPACKQKAHRIAHGQTVLRSEATRKTVAELSERKFCLHCQRAFWENTNGRKRQFCSDSCRVSANRFKHAAAWRFVRSIRAKGDYDAFTFVDENGTKAVDELALQYGCSYNYGTRQYTGQSVSLWEQMTNE